MAFRPRFLRHRGITIIQKLDPSVPRLRRGKVGIVLAGGAVSGGAFKAGGLRALDEALVRRKLPGQNAHTFGLNEFDVFVGLSAGSVLASVLSAGIGTDEVFRILRGTSDTYEAFRPWHFMRPNVWELPKRAQLFLDKEQEAFTNWLSGATDPGTGGRFSWSSTVGKMAQALMRLVPTGLFDPRALAEYLRRNMAKAGISDDFAEAYRQTKKELYLTATDLNRGEIVVFGHDEPYGKIPVSTAIAASCALPLWYKPMLVENPRRGEPGEPDRLDLADGGLMRTANVRVAVEKGCELVICYNPFTRIRYDRAGRHLYEHGLPSILSQGVRTAIGARLDLAKEVVYLDPDVEADIIFIEPAEDDYAFFGMGALNFWTKDRAANHGYAAVRESIESSHDLLASVFHNHGIELRTPPRMAPPVDDEQMQVEMRESRGAHRQVHDALALILAALAGVLTLALLRGDRPLAIALEVAWRFLVTTGVFLRRFWQWLVRRTRGERSHGPELVRAAFEDLGPTYIKLGQIVASSHGLFPDAYCVEFQKCLDRVRPFAFTEVERIVDAEVGLHQFASIEEAPLASASIAQVHAARLHDGGDVVIKIQRPHIERRVEADVRILSIWGWILSFIPTIELANPVGIIDDFRTTIREELDFRLEAANMDEFNGIMEELEHADVRAPRVRHELTTCRVITMERLYGVRVDDVAAIQKKDIDPEERLITGLHAWFQCLIFHGFFHGDVHAGNLMLLDDNGLGFLDFGIIGRFAPRTRKLITDYIVAFATGDYHQLGRVMLSMDAVSQGVDLDAMARDLERAYAPMLKLSFGDIKYGDILPGIMRVSVKHQMRLPREFVLVTKQMLYFDRYAKLLAPRLNIFSDPRLVAAVGQDVMRVRQSVT